MRIYPTPLHLRPPLPYHPLVTHMRHARACPVPSREEEARRRRHRFRPLYWDFCGFGVYLGFSIQAVRFP
eukprot:9485906-Pyramimonas_sp.AAC.1